MIHDALDLFIFHGITYKGIILLYKPPIFFTPIYKHNYLQAWT